MRFIVCFTVVWNGRHPHACFGGWGRLSSLGDCLAISDIIIGQLCSKPFWYFYTEGCKRISHYKEYIFAIAIITDIVSSSLFLGLCP